MVKKVSELMRPAANINMEKPDRKNIEAQIAASHKAIRDAIDHHNRQGSALDKEKGDKISAEVGFHSHKIAALKQLLDSNK